MKKHLILGLLSTACILGLASCGNNSNADAQPYTVTSVDGKYDLAIDTSGSATVYAHGDTKTALKEGFVKIREENSAMTLSFDYDIVDVADGKLNYLFDLDVNGATTSFKVHRGKLLKGLDSDGVIYNQCYDDDGNDQVGMVGCGLLVWNSKIDVKVMKIQCNWSYTYTIADGLKVFLTEEQDSFSDVTCEKNAEGNWALTYDLHGCTLPPFGDLSKGTVVLEDAALRSALLLE